LSGWPTVGAWKFASFLKHPEAMMFAAVFNG
jgi:hypothetical protein